MRPKILIVEEDPITLDFLTMYFQAEGFDVHGAFDGIEGVRLAEREHPDALVFDYHLPKMDGVSMLSKIRENAWAGKMVAVQYTSGARQSALDRAGALNARLWKGLHRFRDVVNAVTDALTHRHNRTTNRLNYQNYQKVNVAFSSCWKPYGNIQLIDWARRVFRASPLLAAWRDPNATYVAPLRCGRVHMQECKKHPPKIPKS